MKADKPRKQRRSRIHPLANLKLQVEVSPEEIMADLQYPTPNRRAYRRP